MAFSGSWTCLFLSLIAAPPAIPPRDLPNPDDVRVLKEAGLSVDFRFNSVQFSGISRRDPAVMARLTRMSWIREVVLHGADVSEVLDALPLMPNLESLYLGDGPYDVDTLEQVCRIRNLRKLTFYGCDLQGADLQALARLPYLEELGLDGTFRGLSWKPLAEHPRLRLLTCRGQGTDDRVAAAVGRSKTIQWFYAHGDDLTDDGVRAAAEATQLRVLMQSGRRITDASIRSLGNLQALEILALDFTSVGDEGVKELLRLNLPSLGRLHLSHSKVTAAGVTALMEGRWRLEHLEVSGIPLDRTAVEALARSPTLRHLHVANCRLTDESFAPLKTMAGLKSLNLNGNYQVSDERIFELKRAVPGLGIWKRPPWGRCF